MSSEEENNSVTGSSRKRAVNEPHGAPTHRKRVYLVESEATSLAGAGAVHEVPPETHVNSRGSSSSTPSEQSSTKQNVSAISKSSIAGDENDELMDVKRTASEKTESVVGSADVRDSAVADEAAAARNGATGFKADAIDEEEKEDKTSSDYYFDSYAHHAIHEEMLKDEVRTKTYQMAILQNKHLFQDKFVLDVGCGTGILSMFAAQAGAKHVYAVDSSSIIWQAKKIVEKNGFAEKITCIKGKIEEIELPVQQIDIIVSEWMGYMLLYESMLETVIYARDKWLVPNGVVFPDKAVLYLAALEDGTVKRERFNFWENVYGFDMTPIKDVAMTEPVVDVVDANAIVTTSVPILHLDILTCTKDDLEFKSKFKLQAQRNDYIHGLVTYFECAFTQIHKPIGFSTAPFAKYTHWKQTILYLNETITICAGETCNGEIACKPNKRNRRDLDIGVTLSFKGRYSEYDKEVHFRLR